jgi:hypothetical protein
VRRDDHRAAAYAGLRPQELRSSTTLRSISTVIGGQRPDLRAWRQRGLAHKRAGLYGDALALGRSLEDRTEQHQRLAADLRTGAGGARSA